VKELLNSWRAQWHAAEMAACVISSFGLEHEAKLAPPATASILGPSSVQISESAVSGLRPCRYGEHQGMGFHHQKTTSRSLGLPWILQTRAASQFFTMQQNKAARQWSLSC
jgi:hypothetical protein